MRFFEWNSCRLFNPKGARENNCALQYASLVISSLSISWFELVRIWSMHWKVKSEKVCGVLLKCVATSQVFLLVFMDDLWFLNLTLNLAVVEPRFWRFFILFYFIFFQYNFIEHTHVQLTFTKDNLQQNENYNMELTKKKPDTIKTLVVTKIKWERNQLSKQNFIPYLKETKKQTILFWTLFRDQSYKKYIFLD